MPAITVHALDTIEINSRPHLISGLKGEPLTVTPYSSRVQVENDLVDEFKEIEEAEGRVSGTTQDPFVLRLAAPDGRQVKILATLEIAEGCYLITGTQGQDLQAIPFEARINRDIALSGRMSDLTCRGFTILS